MRVTGRNAEDSWLLSRLDNTDFNVYLPQDMMNYTGRISGVGISGSNYDDNCSVLRALSSGFTPPGCCQKNNIRLGYSLALVVGHSFNNHLATIITVQ